MIELIREHVEMPSINERRFEVDFKNNRWVVFDNKTQKIRYRSCYQGVIVACHSLNKKYYKELNK
jgi:hypothetical protein